MMTIVHISGDFPDAFRPDKTRAIANLLSATCEARHIVYSINRVDGLGGARIFARHGDVTTVVYRAPPYGILMETCLERLADFIAADIADRGEQADLVHGHKLTIEGFAARRLAAALGGVPFVCTVQGNTDQKYIRTRPDKRADFARLAREAAALFPAAPWTARYIEAKLGIGSAHQTVLPIITTSDRLIAPCPGNGRFVTAFHLRHWRAKGLQNLLAALAILQKRGIDTGLDIIGGGEPETLAGIGKAIARHRVGDVVRLLGPAPHREIQEWFNPYSGFVLTTLRETYGMVYIEALFSGVPIVYSAGRGVDGYFDDADVGVRCVPDSPSRIADAMSACLADERRHKAAIERQQKSGALDRFRAAAIPRTYATALARITGQREIAPSKTAAAALA